MIQVEHLTKWYGSNQAVKDLSFEIGDKGVYGFLGPNGAGKSTTLNMLTGCLSPTEGKITVGGFDILEEPKKAKKRIGYLPEQPPVYMQESPWEYLHFVGEAKGLRGEELETQVSDALAKTGTEDVKHKRIGALSKGYRQRVGIAQALLGDPQVVILDEPTVGLDPIQILDIRNLIRELGRDRCAGCYRTDLCSYVYGSIFKLYSICSSTVLETRGFFRCVCLCKSGFQHFQCSCTNHRCNFDRKRNGRACSIYLSAGCRNHRSDPDACI